MPQAITNMEMKNTDNMNCRHSEKAIALTREIRNDLLKHWSENRQLKRSGQVRQKAQQE